MLTALFQHIPRCIFEPIAVLGMFGFVLVLFRRWQKNRLETVLWGGAMLFMIAWRVVRPINADRYAIILIPLMIFFSVVWVDEIVKVCRKYLHFSDHRLFLALLLIVCAVKSFHGNVEDRQMFAMIEALKADAERFPGKPTVVSNRDVSVFLGDGFEVYRIDIYGPFSVAELPRGDYYLLKCKDKRGPLTPDTPELLQLKSLRHPGGKSEFVLWKRVKP